MQSIFIDKQLKPDDTALQKALGKTYPFWSKIVDYANEINSKTTEEWQYSGEKYGWSFKIKDNKRVFVYLLPRDKFFKVAMVFGQKATNNILVSDIDNDIKKELQAARVYAEGRGIRLEIKDKSWLSDIKKLLEIKHAY